MLEIGAWSERTKKSLCYLLSLVFTAASSLSKLPNLQTAGDWEDILEGYSFVTSLPLSLAAGACIVS